MVGVFTIHIEVLRSFSASNEFFSLLSLPLPYSVVKFQIALTLLCHYIIPVDCFQSKAFFFFFVGGGCCCLLSLLLTLEKCNLTGR